MKSCQICFCFWVFQCLLITHTKSIVWFNGKDFIHLLYSTFIIIFGQYELFMNSLPLFGKVLLRDERVNYTIYCSNNSLLKCLILDFKVYVCVCIICLCILVPCIFGHEGRIIVMFWVFN